MKVLGIDTSGYVNAVSVTDGDQILADFAFEAKSDSLEKIISNIDSVLKNAGLSLKNVNGFGVGLGPGSWTGVRVGVTVGKILAYATNKPIRGVPTLEALAYNARNIPGLICPIINAGRDTVYAAFYRTRNGTTTKVSEYYVGEIQKLLGAIKEPTVFIDSGARFYSKLINQTPDSQSISVKAIEDVQVGAAVALLAAASLEHGNSDDALSLQPLYLKESTARAFINRYSIGVQANSHGQLPTNEL